MAEGRFYEIRRQLGDKPYVLTEDISIPPMSLTAREEWRKASFAAVTDRYLEAKAIAEGNTTTSAVDHTERIERALIGDHYDAARALFAADARGWDMFVSELVAFNKVDGTDHESAPSAEGNDTATPASSP